MSKQDETENFVMWVIIIIIALFLLSMFLGGTGEMNPFVPPKFQ